MINSVLCPNGTSWNGRFCATNSTKCSAGFFWNGQACVQMQQLCPAHSNWVNNRCVPNGNQCPSGSFYNGAQCMPYQPCTGGRIWSSQLSRCICANSNFWNGNLCVKCGLGQQFSGHYGCFCPVGTFYDGNGCTTPGASNCSAIANSNWNGSHCVCQQGFSAIGYACACQGLAVGNYCDQCFNKPNSQYLFGTCQCNRGYYEHQGACLTIIPNPNPSANISCNVATFFDNQQKRCLPCADGCLSCATCYTCTQCQAEYNFDFTSGLCI